MIRGLPMRRPPAFASSHIGFRALAGANLVRIQNGGGHPLARARGAAGGTTSAPGSGRLLLLPTCSELPEAHECRQGRRPLLPLGLQAPSIIHKTTHSQFRINS